MTAPDAAPRPDQPALDPLTVMRSRAYVGILLVAAVLGVPISAAAYFFLQLVGHVQTWVFTDLPEGLGLDDPVWWPVLPLLLAGLLVGLTIRYLPGRGGESPADGFHPHDAPAPRELLGIFLASFTTLGLGVVLGPEAPLIAMGAGLGAWAMQLVKRDAPLAAVAVVGAAGSFAAVSTLLGSPLLGAFLLLEASGIAGLAGSLVLVPGLLSAGIGALIFIGLDSLVGLGSVSLVIPDLPPFDRPSVAEFGWALAIGLGAAVLGTAIRWLALRLKVRVEQHVVVGAVAVGLVVALLAIAYALMTDNDSSDVLFSGQSALPSLISHSSDYSVLALLALVACKSLAYGVSMSAFRGGPVFPAMFIGAAGGIALSHAPGLSMVAGVAMGIGAMCATMLRLPMTSVLLATLLLLSDGLAVMPLVIVAVVVAFVAGGRLLPAPAAAVETGSGARPEGEAVPSG